MSTTEDLTGILRNYMRILREEIERVADETPPDVLAERVIGIASAVALVLAMVNPRRFGGLRRESVINLVISTLVRVASKLRSAPVVEHHPSP